MTIHCQASNKTYIWRTQPRSTSTYNQTQSPHLSYFMKQYSYTHILSPLMYIGVSIRSMSFLYSSAIRRTAMKWLSQTIPTAQLFWSNSKLSHMCRARCGTMGLFLFYQRGRAGTCHAVNTNAGESKGRKDDGGVWEVPGRGRGGALRQPERGGKWGETSRWICGYVLSLLETCNYLKSGMTRSWRTPSQRSKTFYTERQMCDRGHGGKVSLT